MLYPTTSVEVLELHDRLTECEVCCKPVPDRLIVGELLALLLIVTLPDTVPALVGEKITVNVAV